MVAHAASDNLPVPRAGEAIFASITLYGRVLELEGEVAGANDDVVELHFPAPLAVPPSTMALGKVIRLWHGGACERAQVVATTVGESVAIVVRTLTSLQAIDGRRSFARVPVAPVETLVVVAPPLRLQALHASVIDLSGGGCGLISPRTLPDGARTWLQLRRPRSREAAPVEAQIRSTHPLGYFSHAGAMFIGIDNAAREALIHELVEAERLWRAEIGLRG